MQLLNERFAGYVDRVRFLDAQNTRLVDELGRLESLRGTEAARIKAMFHVELQQARRLLYLVDADETQLQLRASSLEQELDHVTQK